MKAKSFTVGGMIYEGNGKFFRGYVRVKEGEIAEVNTGQARSEDYRGIVLPKFVNAHTHVGDAVVESEPKGSLEEIVAPPDGLKFRVLREKKALEKIRAMRAFIRSMAKTTALFVDFREEGVEGIENLHRALRQLSLKARILGRPVLGNAQEIEKLLDLCDGIGMSAISDWEFDYLSMLSQRAKARGKFFALHVSERIREEIEKVLALKPDFIVHMCRASREDIMLCARKGIPVVLCPRANLLFGNFPDVKAMLEEGCSLMLGTDNAMFNTPSIFREMEFLYKCRLKGYIEPEKILSMAIDNPRRFFLGQEQFFVRGTRQDFIVLSLPLTDPAYQVVARGSEDLLKLSF